MVKTVINRMDVYTPSEGFADFLHFVACCKRYPDQWRYLHISLDPAQGEGRKLPVGEILQFLSFNFQRVPPTVFSMPAENQVIVVTNFDNAINLSKFERGIAEHFRDNHITTTVYDFEASGVVRLTKLLSNYVQEGNIIHRTLFKRLSRPSNMIMILDDDQVVTRQLEKVMSSFGAVYVMNDPEGFLDRYQEYAPDILFLDIHLKTAMGNKLLRDLTAKVDPHAYVVMVSSDTEEKVVMDVKGGGARGFLVKPFNRNQILQHISKAPTFALRLLQGTQAAG